MKATLFFFIFSLIALIGCNSNSKYSKPLNVQLGYSEKDILVIVHADDIGMQKDETDGVLKSMEYGMCKTGSLMVMCPDFDRAVEIYLNHPALDFGIHFALNSEWKDTYTWKPVLPKSAVPSLYNSAGVMWADQKELSAHMNPEEAKMELEAQIKKALDAGVKITHMDAHMGSYFQNPALFDFAVELAKKYNLPIATWGHPKTDELRRKGYAIPDSITCIYLLDKEAANPDLRKQEYYKWMKGLKPGVHEIVVHIANVTKELGKIIEMPYIRSGDYNFWTSDETKKLAAELGIKFIGFRELKKLQAVNWGITKCNTEPENNFFKKLPL